MEKVYNEHNRFKFLNSIKNKESKYFIACLDIIKFREINDKYGILEGDKILKEIIKYTEYLDERAEYKIECCIYEKDVILISIESIDENEVIKIISQIVLNKYSYKIQFRAGYRKINDSKEMVDFIENVNVIIKNKKYEVIDEVSSNLDLSKDIEKCIKIKECITGKEEGFFYLVYQPKINVNTKKIESCEVLSRCRNEELGNIFPSEFLPIINELNYQYEFDLFIFETMCKEIANMKKYIRKFSINFSISSMTKMNIVDKLLDLVGKYSIEPSDITIEILEDLCCDQDNTIYNNINKLVDYGFNISIDDFGTGYSSYYRLAALRSSEIKIPREFLLLEDNFNNIENKNILSAIIEFCKKMEYKIVSEGVETKEDDEFMKNLGVDYIQGYFYSKPLEKLDFIDFILNFNRSL